MFTLEEFKKEVLTAMEGRPEWSRKGQFVFNYIDEVYHVARTVQFKGGIDCFHNDNNIDAFIECAYQYLKEYNDYVNEHK